MPNRMIEVNNNDSYEVPRSTESAVKTYIDPQGAQVIIDMIADLKQKTAMAEEQLLLLEVEAT